MFDFFKENHGEWWCIKFLKINKRPHLCIWDPKVVLFSSGYGIWYLYDKNYVWVLYLSEERHGWLVQILARSLSIKNRKFLFLWLIIITNLISFSKKGHKMSDKRFSRFLIWKMNKGFWSFLFGFDTMNMPKEKLQISKNRMQGVTVSLFSFPWSLLQDSLLLIYMVSFVLYYCHLEIVGKRKK